MRMDPDFKAEVLRRLDQIVLLLQRGQESRSSVQVSSSARGVDVTAKSYADGLIDQAGREAVDQWLTARDALNDSGAAAFEKTLKSASR